MKSLAKVGSVAKRRQLSDKEREERDRQILAMLKEGHSLREIARSIGLSHEWCRQIAAKQQEPSPKATL